MCAQIVKCGERGLKAGQERFERYALCGEGHPHPANKSLAFFPEEKKFRPPSEAARRLRKKEKQTSGSGGGGGGGY